MNRFGELRRVRRRKPARSDGFANGRIQWSATNIAGNAARRGGALFNSTAAASGENNHRGAGGVINGERKKELPRDVDLFFNQNGFNWKLSNFHRQHARRVGANIIWRSGESHPANAGTPGGPSLNLDYHFAAFFAACEFFGGRNRAISSGRGAATRNLESVCRENGFALIFVKSCHGWVLFPRS